MHRGARPLRIDRVNAREAPTPWSARRVRVFAVAWLPQWSHTSAAAPSNVRSFGIGVAHVRLAVCGRWRKSRGSSRLEHTHVVPALARQLVLAKAQGGQPVDGITSATVRQPCIVNVGPRPPTTPPPPPALGTDRATASS